MRWKNLNSSRFCLEEPVLCTIEHMKELDVVAKAADQSLGQMTSKTPQPRSVRTPALFRCPFCLDESSPRSRKHTVFTHYSFMTSLAVRPEGTVDGTES